MRRADRLFRLVQALQTRRGGRSVTTARELAQTLEVSERTIYRDIADLAASGVPIVGEAGIGYALGRGFELPPLVFTEDEIEALVLGARVVASWGDPALASATDQLLAKVEAVLPERLRARVSTATLFAPGFHVPAASIRSLAPLRKAIAARRKVRFQYRDREGAPTARTVRPLGLFFWGQSWTVAAWCELRRDFRGFRLDRMEALEPLAETFEAQEGRTLEDFFASLRREVGGDPLSRRTAPANEQPGRTKSSASAP